jgi:hypothetical protein
MEANGDKSEAVVEHQELPKEAMVETIKRTDHQEMIIKGASVQQWTKGLRHNMKATSEEGEGI